MLGPAGPIRNGRFDELAGARVAFWTLLRGAQATPASGMLRRAGSVHSRIHDLMELARARAAISSLRDAGLCWLRG